MYVNQPQFVNSLSLSFTLLSRGSQHPVEATSTIEWEIEIDQRLKWPIFIISYFAQLPRTVTILLASISLSKAVLCCAVHAAAPCVCGNLSGLMATGRRHIAIVMNNDHTEHEVSMPKQAATAAANNSTIHKSPIKSVWQGKRIKCQRIEQNRIAAADELKFRNYFWNFRMVFGEAFEQPIVIAILRKIDISICFYLQFLKTILSLQSENYCQHHMKTTIFCAHKSRSYPAKVKAINAKKSVVRKIVLWQKCCKFLQQQQLWKYWQ